MRKVTPDTATRVLAGATGILAVMESDGVSLDDALDFQLRFPELRRTVSSLLFLYFRRKRMIDSWLGNLAARPPRGRVRRLLAAALTQIRFQNGIAPESAVNVAVELAKSGGNSGEAKFVNAVLRRAVQCPAAIDDSPEAVFPPALLTRWRNRYSPEELAQFSSAFLTPAGFTFRAERDFDPEALASAPVECYGPYRFFEAANPAAILESSALQEGKLYIQDPATSFALSLPDFSGVKTVLDVCAAPGGKSLLAAERMEPGAMLTAADRSERRQLQTKENFQKRKLDFPVISAEPAALCGSFDLVIADVPCSNTGVFRRRPDALWRFNVAELGKVAMLQRSILEAAAARVAPGGQLLYSTCSIEPEENALQLEQFLADFPAFSRISGGQLLPDLRHDGAYACLLRRNAQSI